MSCTRFGNVIACGPGRYRYLVRASCPWCCLQKAQTVHAFRHVFSGWAAPDLVCGRCGQQWSADMETLKSTGNYSREENRLMVRGMKRRLTVRRRFPPPPGMTSKTRSIIARAALRGEGEK